jgi:signal transduction histidine kinase
MVVCEDITPRNHFIVTAIEAEMQQVVLNLALNALEAAPPNTGQVRIELARQDGCVELSVSDNGRGILAETLARVFEPFFTEKRGSRQAGTGLGLSITHRIVEAHGGTIAAQSDGPGLGSRFVVNLPAAVSAEART